MGGGIFVQKKVGKTTAKGRDSQKLIFIEGIIDP
jgi:hypothetical protein